MSSVGAMDTRFTARHPVGPDRRRLVPGDYPCGTSHPVPPIAGLLGWAVLGGGPPPGPADRGAARLAVPGRGPATAGPARRHPVPGRRRACPVAAGAPLTAN